MKSITKTITLLNFGGIIYIMMEFVWRGYTHPSMFVVGGLCFVQIGLINEIFPWNMPLPVQMAIAAGLVTAAELLAGRLLNLWLGLHVWDYSNMPLNILGQICVPYMGLWYLLSLPAIVLDDWLRYWLFKEDRPHYVWR